MSAITYPYICFTDASHKRHDGNDHCGFGVVLLNTETNEYCQLGGYLTDQTCAYGEAWAIYEGVRLGLKKIAKRNCKKKRIGLLIVTDSKLSVEAFTKYIPRCWDTSNWQKWKTKQGKLVKNQSVFRATVDLMCKHPGTTVRITHMHSHQSLTHTDKIKKDLEKHGIKADDDTVAMFIEMNAKADHIAKSYVDHEIRLEEVFGHVPVLR